MVKKIKKKKKNHQNSIKSFDISKIRNPPVKPRFFPGEVHEGLIKVDYEFYKAHRITVAQAKPVVDNKPPKFDPNIYYDRKKLNEDARSTRITYDLNIELAKKINEIFRTGGKVDCWNLKYKKYNPERKVKEIEYDLNFTKRLNLDLHKKLNSLSSEYSPQVMAKEWKKMKALIEEKSRFPWFKTVSKYPSISENAVMPTNEQSVLRTRCFFDIELSLSNTHLGRIVFELYNDFVPSICANFEAFCRGHKGLSYKGTPFHRIVLENWCQGGDVTKFNGKGEASIYTEPIPEENFTLKHSCPGVLTTINDNKNACDSKFNLTFRPLENMDGKRIVFGKVIKGLNALLKIETFGTKFGNPLQKVIISNCDVIPRRNSIDLKDLKNHKKSNNKKEKTT